MKQQHIVITAALLGSLALTAQAQQKPDANSAVIVAKEPGKVAVATTTKISATVTAIDKQQRKVTLKGPEGNSTVLAVGPDVRNFDQVKVGDLVVVTYAEALTLTLKKDGKELRGMTQAADGARTASGARPGGVVAQQVEVTADVIAVNATTQTVTLRGPKQVVDLKVPDPEQFKLIKVGDQIQAVYTEAMALTVEPAAAAKK
jgi:hypothetical protein